MVRPWVVDGGDGLQIWMVAANTSKYSREQPTRGDPPYRGLGVGISTPFRKTKLLQNVSQGLGLERMLQKN
jgi:hypothetical protein